MSKFQIVKGITNNLEETPYIEGKVYFTYDNEESEDITIYADIDGVRRKIKEGIKREDLDNYLLKTDIADWAKANTKPTYTSEEVGALNASHPASNVTNNKIQNWDSAYTDSGKVTQTNSGATLSGYHPVLITKQNIVGDSENTDSVYKSNNLYLSSDGKLFDSYYGENGSALSLQLKPRDLEIYAGEGNQTSKKGVILKFPKISSDENQTYTCILPEKTGTIALTNDLPAVPTKTSELTNDSEFLTEETDPTIHILVLQEDENGELTTGEDDSISGYVNNNELVIIYYEGKPYFYDKTSDRGYSFNGINGNDILYSYLVNYNKWSWYVGDNSNNYINFYDIPTNVSDFNNDAGYITQETDPTVPAWAKEATKPTYTAAEVGALPDTTVIPEDKVFIATYGTTTYADTLAAYNAGKLIFAVYNNGTTNGKTIFPLTRKTSSFFQFEGRYLNGLSTKTICELSSSGWTTTSYFGDTITRTVDIASGDRLIIRDLDDNSTMKSSSLTFGTETNQYLANNGTWQTIPENTSDLTNDSGFQTSTEVNSAIATAIGNINQFNVAIVSTLPSENIDNHTIYFVSNGESGNNVYDEWMYINNNWERIGGTSVDLSGYMQTSHPANSITTNKINEWDAKLSSYTETDPVYTASPAATITSEKITAWDAKSDFSGSYNDLSDKPTIPTVPNNVSAFTNDSGYLTSYTETDPTVPAWAKAESKPTYTYSEVGAAASSHAHGSITNAGAITSNTALANGDRLVFSDSSDSNLLKRSSITLGTSTTQYFANNGTWQNIPTTSVSQTLTTGTEIGKVNGTSLYAPNPYDDSALAARVTALENLEWATYYSGRQNPSDSQGTNGDIYLQY